MAHRRPTVGDSGRSEDTMDGSGRTAVGQVGLERYGNGRPPPGGTDADDQPHAPGGPEDPALPGSRLPTATGRCERRTARRLVRGDPGRGSAAPGNARARPGRARGRLAAASAG